jgi:hypothetical protein
MTEPRICAYPPCRRVLDELGLRADAKWCGPACSTAWSRANPGKSRRIAASPNVARTRRRSGPQISYRKVVEYLASIEEAQAWPRDDALAFAERQALMLLPARQRARLEAKR